MNIDDLASEYARDGVVKVEALLSAADIDELRTRLDAYTQNNLPALPPGDFVLESDGKTVRNFWRMDQHDHFFAELSRRGAILDLVRTLVHGEPVVMGVESFNKPARIGSPVPPHQDNAYFCLAPPDALTVWIALDAATMDNGPIHYLPGSHRNGLLPHVPSGVAGNSMGLQNPPPHDEPIIGLLEPGDALIHHSETIHYSAANTSEHARLGMLLVYRGAHCIKSPDLLAAYEKARSAPRSS